MEKSALHYRENTFGPDIADECNLRVVIGMDGLSLSVRRKHRVHQYLHTWTFPKEHRETSLRRILNTEEIVAFPYQNIELLYVTPWATVMPKRMFDPQLTGEYLTTLTENTNNKAEHAFLNEGDLAVVWANDARLTDIGRYFFPDAQQLPYTPLLLNALRGFMANKQIAVCAHLRASTVQLAAFEGGHLLFFNSFSYEKPADLLYFTLLVYDQFHLKPGEVPLFLSGELVRESEIYKQYERFVRNIHFLPAPPIHGIPDSILPHFYLDQTL